jgi:hypothetical protein
MVTAAIWLAFLGALICFEPDTKNHRDTGGGLMMLAAAIIATMAVNA